MFELEGEKKKKKVACHDDLTDGKWTPSEESQSSCNIRQKINAKYISIDVGSRLHLINCFKQYQQPKKRGCRNSDW